MIRVLIVDDEPIARRGIRQQLRNEADLEVIDEVVVALLDTTAAAIVVPLGELVVIGPGRPLGGAIHRGWLAARTPRRQRKLAAADLEPDLVARRSDVTLGRGVRRGDVRLL